VPSVTPRPLTLTDVFTQVAGGHPLLAAARARVGSAQGARRASAVLPNPFLSAQIENIRLPGGATPDMDRETMVSAMFPLEFLYQRGARVGEATATVRAAEAEALTARQQLALDAAHTYYQAALGQVEVATARDLAAWLDSLVSYNRTRVHEGAAAGADLLRTELERDRAWVDVTTREVELASTNARLVALLGQGTAGPDGADRAATSPAVVIPDMPLPLPAAQPEGADQLGVDPLDRRPEVRAARARLAAASANVGIAHSMLVREFGLMTGFKWTGGTTSLVAGLSLPLPLINQNGGGIAQARAERDAAAADLAAAEREAGADIAAATEGARLLTERAQVLAGTGDSARRDQPSAPAGYLTRADETRRITLGAYREGAVSLLQVLDAARAWGDARATYYSTLYAQHEAVLALLVAQGSDLFTAVPKLIAATTQPTTTPMHAGDPSPTPSR
jgi:cobalt-zinc-cadmium efflux system outer membrane protein